MANYTKEEQFKMIRDSYCGYKNLKKIDNQYEEVCLEAIKKSEWAIQYVENPTDEMKLEAVNKNGWAIQYIENPTNEICFLHLNIY